MIEPTPAHLTELDQMTRKLRAAGYSITRAEPTYLRHKPQETTIIAYRLTCPDGRRTWAYAHWCCDTARADQVLHKATALGVRPSPAGPGLTRLDGHTVFYAFPNDARLRRLRWYTDPRKIKRSLEPLIGSADRISGSRTIAEVLRYKPERRVVVRIDLATTKQTRTLLVRYSTHRRADHLSRVATHLRRHGVNTPAPVAHLDDDHVGVDEYLDGIPARDAVRAGTSDPAMLAEAIARFHASGVPSHTPRRTAPADLARARAGLTGLGTRHPDLAGPARATASMLQQRLPRPSARSVLLHGDLHAENILLHQGRPWFVDLERVATGPAAVDLGFFTAHALAIGIRAPGLSPHAADHARSVTDHYQAGNGPVDRAALAWHTALGLVEQAVLVTRHLEPGWQHTSNQLLEMARCQLDHDRILDRVSGR